MRVVHWSIFNGSGLATMGIEMCKAEQELGNPSIICDTQDMSTWSKGMEGDIHVIHSHMPDSLIFDRGKKVVAVQHGSPEHVFEESVKAGLTGNYGASDPLAMAGYFLKRADAVITFWARQEFILRKMTSAPLFCLPMGTDTTFWNPVPKQNLLTGKPAVLTAENHHNCKWPIDAMLMWPYVVEQVPSARIHFMNVPYDQHRWWVPLSYMTGTVYTSYMGLKFSPTQLKNFFAACDFYYSPVRYGDYNRVSLEAKACGAKVISYRGNEYADYWITEGDQREQAKELIDILQGKREPREVKPVPDIKDTAARMLEIYRSILNGKL